MNSIIWAFISEQPIETIKKRRKREKKQETKNDLILIVLGGAGFVLTFVLVGPPNPGIYGIFSRSFSFSSLLSFIYYIAMSSSRRTYSSSSSSRDSSSRRRSRSPTRSRQDYNEQVHVNKETLWQNLILLRC